MKRKEVDKRDKKQKVWMYQNWYLIIYLAQYFKYESSFISYTLQFVYNFKYVKDKKIEVQRKQCEKNSVTDSEDTQLVNEGADFEPKSIWLNSSGSSLHTPVHPEVPRLL